MGIKDLISKELSGLSKIALALTTDIHSIEMKMLAPPFSKMFAKMDEYGGKRHFNLEQNIDRFKNTNPEFDINSIVDYYVNEQVNSKNKKIIYDDYNGSVFASNPETKQSYLAEDIYEPNKINASEFQLPLINLARLSIADTGVKTLEEKVKLLKSGVAQLNDRCVELFNQLIKSATNLAFIEQYKKQYLVKIDGLYRDVHYADDGKCLVEYSTAGGWEEDFGTHQREYYPGDVVFRAKI